MRLALFHIITPLLLVLFYPTSVHAKPSAEVLQNRSNQLYQVCQGKDLQIMSGVIVRVEDKQPLTLVKWPWKKEELSAIIEILSTGEPFRNYIKYNNDCEKDGGTYYIGIGDNDGCHVVKCGDHYLDISDTKYFIDGIEINETQTQNIFINNSGTLIQGDNNKIEQPIKTGISDISEKLPSANVNQKNNFEKLFGWLDQNKEWLFGSSGVGGLLLILARILKRQSIASSSHSGSGGNVSGSKTENHYYAGIPNSSQLDLLNSSPLPLASQNREFTKRTPRELLSFYTSDRTQLESNRLIQPYVGLWIEAQGEVIDVGHGAPDGDQTAVLLKCGNDQIECRFNRTWKQKLDRLAKGESVKITGKIKPTQNGHQLYLLECELVQNHSTTATSRENLSKDKKWKHNVAQPFNKDSWMG